ncbi:MAG TPA: 2Fe-2S iron-sulfur cluster-binding protein [Candidatus Binataceae bacterium]|nr:2Fe-2S iron-sulfur cluster-binding protein [Candidatus Binataceae bacterium]
MADSPKMVHVTVDGRQIAAVEGAPLLQAMLDAGLDIPHYCYHPKLSIDGSCRLCQVRIEGIPKLQISCNTQVRDGMVVHTQDDEVALTRRGVLELLLMNHPLDCPICDKAGECWLQNYAMRFSSRFSRTLEPRRKREKRIDIGDRMLLDQERCILCRRCVRFCREISQTAELAVFNLGDRSVLDIHAGQRLNNDYSMCTADVCPVGALETKDFHHKLRVWFLEETASVCGGCANGCNINIGTYRNRIWRLTPRRNDAVNDTWMCDAGRLDYKFVGDKARLWTPLIARDGAMIEADWMTAIARAGAALVDFKHRNGGAAFGAIVSPHLTNEDAFCFGRLLAGLGTVRCAMPITRGKSDDLLIKAEKAANGRGVRELGLVSGADDGLEDLLRAIDSGEIKGLYLCGGDLMGAVPRERVAAIFAKLELLIVQDLRLDELFASARIFFPTTSFAEKDGTFTNYAGRVQRIQRAIEPPPGWLGDGEVFTRILNLIESRQEEFALAQVWAAMERDGRAFEGLRFDQIGAEGTPLPDSAAAK